MRRVIFSFACWVSAAAIWPTYAAAQPSIAVEEGWANAWGGAPLAVPLLVKSDKPLDVSLAWTVAFEQRVLVRGEMRVKTGAGEAQRVVLAVDVPPVREGTVLQTEFTAMLIAPRLAEPLASHTQPLWIFPKDPFADRRRWLEDLNITLYDPAGATIRSFEQASIPFRLLRSQAALASVDKGIVVVGEGVSWRENRGLSAELLRAAAQGRPVLCLAPADGDLTLGAVNGGELPRLQSFSLRQTDIVHELDKRLDAQSWQGQPAVSHSLRLRGEGDDAVVSAMEGADGWPWLEARFSDRAGSLIVCGFGVVRHAEAGPAPRFLLSCLLERLVAQQATTPPRK